MANDISAIMFITVPYTIKVKRYSSSAPIAQLGERKTEDLKVTGSISSRNPGSGHSVFELQ